MRNFREYDIWKTAMQIAKETYTLTKTFPEDEKFGLISQVRRAAVSIPANIAEGAGRKTQKEFAQYLHISQGSAFELETHLLLSLELNYIHDKDLEIIIEPLHKLQKQITHLIEKLK
jgi:four helix bundle protein